MNTTPKRFVIRRNYFDIMLYLIFPLAVGTLSKIILHVCFNFINKLPLKQSLISKVKRISIATHYIFQP